MTAKSIEQEAVSYYFWEMLVNEIISTRGEPVQAKISPQVILHSASASVS